MSPTQNPAAGAVASDETIDGEVRPVPDQDGPHDVPDDQVIEKTLPTVPVADIAGRSD